MANSLDIFTDDNITSLNIFPEKASTMSDKYNAGLASQLAHVNSITNPDKTLYEHFNEAKASLSSTDDQDAIIRGAVADYRNYYSDILVEAAAEDVQEGEDIQEVIEVVQELDDMSAQLFGESYALEAAQMQAAGGSRLDEASLEQAFYHRQIASLADGIGTLETIKDFSMLILPTIGIDLAEVTGGNVFTSYNDFKILARNFWELDKETRLQVFPHLVSDILEATDTLDIENRTKAIMLISTIFDPNRDDQLDLENVLEKADWALIATPLVTGVMRAVKGYNAVKNAARAGDNRLAGEANNAAMGDAGVAEVLEQDQIVSVANATPFRYEDIMPEATDGISADVIKAAEETVKRRAATQTALDDAMREDNLLQEAALTEPEKLLVQEKALNSLDELKDEIFNQEGKYLTDATITKTSDTGFSVSYKLDGVDKVQDIRYRYSDVGEFDYLSAGAIETKIASPQVWMDRILKDSVEVATRLGFAQHKLLGQLQTASRAAMKGVGRKERKNVDDVLIAGDAWDNGSGKLFTTEELLGGISVGDRLVKLSPKGVGSYYAQRDIFDAMHFLKNGQVRSDLEFHGWKAADIGFEMGIGKDYIVKPYEALNTVPKELYQKPFKILDTRGSGTERLSYKMKLKELYEQDYIIVKLRSPAKHGDDEFDFALVKKDVVTELPANVLHKKVAYVPKIAKDGWFWVKKSEPITRNGIPGHTKISTMRAFDNMRDAQKYADDLNVEAPTGTKYEAKRDRDLTVSEKNAEIISEAGGMWTGHRSTREIKFGLEGTELKRESAYDAMQRGLQHVSNQIPINEWRMGMIQRWTDSAKKYMANPEKEMAKGLDAEISLARVGSKEEVALRSSREWIRDQLRIPTEAEQRWSNMTGRMGEWMEGKPFLDTDIKALSVRRGMMNLSSKDPFSAMRGAAFHTLLGWFNPAQLFVQAQGASIAFALDPISAPKRIRDYMALRAAYQVRKNKTAVARTAKAAGIDPKELQEMVDQLDKTGLMESIKNTADYNAAAQGYGMAMDGLRRAADKGLMFYIEGERGTRGYAFLTARANWIKRNPGKTINDDALKEILTRTTTKMLNLTRANRAHWQKGVWSLPTQFQQVTTKFIENMLPDIMPGAAKKFTGGEKARILAGQLFLYGGASVPFGNWIASELAEAAGQDPTTVSDEWKAAATDGFWGFMSELMFDTHFTTGTRGAFASGIEQFYEDLFLREVPMSETALGAFGTVPKRVFNALEKMAPLVTNPTTFNYTAQEFANAALGVTDIFSSFSGFHKAYMWYKYQEMTDNKGNIIVKLDDNDAFIMALGRASGFNPARYDAYFKGSQWLAAKAEMEKEKRTAYRKLMREYMSPGATFDKAHIQNFKLRKANIFVGFNEFEINKVVEGVHKDIWSGDTKEDKQMKNVLKGWYDGEDLTQGKETIMFNKEIGE